MTTRSRAARQRGSTYLLVSLLAFVEEAHELADVDAAVVVLVNVVEQVLQLIVRNDELEVRERILQLVLCGDSGDDRYTGV